MLLLPTSLIQARCSLKGLPIPCSPASALCRPSHCPKPKWLPTPCSCAHTDPPAMTLLRLLAGPVHMLPPVLTGHTLWAHNMRSAERLRSARGGHRRSAVVRARARGSAAVARRAVLPALPGIA